MRTWLLAGLFAAASMTPALGGGATGPEPEGRENAPAAPDAKPAPAATPEEIEALVRALGADAFADREAATKRLAEIGRPARDAVRAALASDDAEVRYRARVVLRTALRNVKHLLDQLARGGGSSDDRAFGELVAMGDDAIEPLVTIVERELAENNAGDGGDRIRLSLLVLEKIGSPRAVAPLCSLLELNLQRFPALVAQALRRSGEAEAKAALREKRRGGTAAARRNAVEILGAFRGEDVVAELAASLSDPDGEVRREAVTGLLRAAERTTRRAYIEAVEVSGGRPVPVLAPVEPARASAEDAKLAKVATDAILGALDDQDLQVQCAALDALARLGDARALPRVREVVRARNPADVRLAPAVAAVGRLRDTKAVPLLVPLLSLEPGTARVAAETLGKLRAPEAAPGLAALLDADDVAVQRAAIRALGEIADPRSFAPLAAYLGRPDRSPCAPDAIDAVGKLAGLAPRRFLVERVKDSKDDNELKRALDALEARDDGLLADDEAVEEAALATLEKRAPGASVRALEILGRRRFAPAVEAVTRALRSSEEGIREKAAEALGEIGDRRALEPLRELAKAGGPEYAAWALARLGDMGPIGERITAEEERRKGGSDVDRMSLGIDYIYKRDLAAAEKEFRAILDDKSESAGSVYIAAYNLACTCSLAGRTAEAIEWLRKSVDLGYGRGSDELPHMEVDSDLDAIRATEGYRAIAAELKRGAGARSADGADAGDGSALEGDAPRLRFFEGADSTELVPVPDAPPPPAATPGGGK